MARGSVRVTRSTTLKSPRILTATEARVIGLQLCAKIENRTLSGVDEQRRAFHPYSEDYGTRVKHRLRPVDLRRTGKMLGDLDVVVATSHRIGIGFRSAEAEQRAEYHDGLAGHDGKRGSNPLRRFLGLQPSWIDEIVRRIKSGMRLG
jgi:hypothetical protein